MSDAAILSLILQSALRSLLLGASVYALVRFVRLRDLSAETVIWSAVLIAALAMPALTALVPAMAVRLPIAAPHPVARSALGPSQSFTPWLVAHGGLLTMAAYILITFTGLMRLGVGLVLTARLHAQAEPIAEPWAEGRDIRQCAAIDAPLSYARAILLPLDWRDWRPEKLQAVLAHEDCHIRRGDFFILLLASIHRAIFWFSPFAWWLQARLGALAETASDKAAVGRIADPAGYAEILVEVARRASRLHTPAMAMAKGPGVARRIDYILTGIPEKTFGAMGRALVLTAVLALSVGLAAVRADTLDREIRSDRSAPSRRAQSAVRQPRLGPAAHPPAAARTFHSRRADNVSVSVAGSAASLPEEAVSYDPRALLDAPEVAALPAVIIAGHSGSTGADD